MAFPIAAAIGIGSGLASMFKGDPNKNTIKEQRREFDISNTPDIARRLETSGLRDKLLAIFNQQVGQAPSPFRARDMFNPSTSVETPQFGGYGQGAQPQAAGSTGPGGAKGVLAGLTGTLGGFFGGSQGGQAQAGQGGYLSLPADYHMGAGGVNTDVYNDLLRRLGYNPPAAPKAPVGAPVPGAPGSYRGIGAGGSPWQVGGGMQPWAAGQQGGAPYGYPQRRV